MEEIGTKYEHISNNDSYYDIYIKKHSKSLDVIRDHATGYRMLWH
jgi:hypothetical protein